MNTECPRKAVQFHLLSAREATGKLDGGRIGSDGGGVLWRETQRRTRILQRLAGCFEDYRNPELAEHSVESLIGQRVMGRALGYEDLKAIAIDCGTIRCWRG
ncbi:MAG: transposase [Methylococcales bacterium]